MARLQILVKQQRQLLSDMKPERLWYLKNESIQLREQLRSAKALKDGHDKVKKEHKELRQRSCTEQQMLERSLRRVKAKLQKLEVEHNALQNHVRLKWKKIDYNLNSDAGTTSL